MCRGVRGCRAEHFRLYALDANLTLQPGATRQELDAAMKGHIIGKAEHMGTYRR